MADARPFDPALFADAAIDAETANLNSDMIQMLTGQPEWWIVGAAAMRAARRRGEGPFPAPVMSNRARTLTITGKDGSVETLKAGSRTQTARIEIMSWSCYGYSLQFAWRQNAGAEFFLAVLRSTCSSSTMRSWRRSPTGACRIFPRFTLI